MIDWVYIIGTVNKKARDKGRDKDKMTTHDWKVAIVAVVWAHCMELAIFGIILAIRLGSTHGWAW